MERLYRDVSLIGAASLLATSSAYFAQIAVPQVLLLLAIPASFGVTAYLSRQGFNRAVAASLIAVPFAVLGPKMAITAVVVALGNVFVSVFAGGERFRDYYGATRLPLLFLGIVVGVGLFGMVQSDPQMEEQVRDSVAGFTAQTAGQTVQEAGIIDQQKNQRVGMVEDISTTTVRSTQQYVLKDENLTSELSDEEWTALSMSLDRAAEDVPDRMTSRVNQSMSQSGMNVTSVMQDLVRSQLSSEMMVIMIPLIVFLALSLQPVTGLVAALTAFIAGRVDPQNR
jgi:hypothetical protein